jgi:branched-chain amino acid transport system substrate-binding protein
MTMPARRRLLTTSRGFGVPLLLAAGALGVAACGSSSDDSSSSDGDATGPIAVGFTTPLAASVGGLGAPAAEGLKIAAKEINARGGVKGRQLKLDIQDNSCTASGGVTAVQKLLSAKPQPVAVLGGFCSDSTLAAAPIVQRAQVPLLVDGASNPKITEQAGAGGNPWVFRWVPNDNQTASATIGNLAKTPGIKKIAIVADNLAYGRGGSDALAAAAKAKGLQVLSKDLVDLNSPDFASIIARLQNEKPDAVALWLTQAKTFYDQYGQSGLRRVPLAGQIDLTQKAIKRYNLTGFNTYQYSPGTDTPENKAFLTKWKAAGQDVSVAYIGFMGYEGLLVLADALQKADDVSPSGVKDALTKLDYGPTLNGGRIRFDDHHQAFDNIATIAFSGTKQTTSLIAAEPQP